MLLKTFSVASLFAIGATAGFLPFNKRDTITDVTIYAYGAGISGLPILADTKGIAHVSAAAVQPSNLSSVTWTISTTGTAEWSVSINSTNSTSTTSGTFYIVPTSGSFSAVGFVNSSASAPTGAETSGFRTYGNDVVYTDGSSLKAQFWAMATNATDEWEIVWNTDGTKETGAVPVTLKTTAPAI